MNLLSASPGGEAVQVIPSGSDALRIGRKSGILRFIKLKKKEIFFLKPDF
jgi:hypothetical protein